MKNDEMAREPVLRYFHVLRSFGDFRAYISDLYQNCHSTCFVFYLNGTNKETGHTTVLGVGRGCSASFLTDDQHLHLGLGAHSRPSHVGEYLPHDFDQVKVYFIFEK